MTTHVETERLEEMLAGLGEDTFAGITRTAAVRVPEFRSILTHYLSLRQEQPAGVVKGLARYRVVANADQSLGYFEHADGDWVRAEDIAALEPQQEEAVAWREVVTDIRDRCSRRPSLSGARTKDEILSRALSNSSDLGHIMEQCNALLRQRTHPTPVQKVQESQPLTSPPDAGGGNAGPVSPQEARHRI